MMPSRKSILACISGKHLSKLPYDYRCAPNDKDKWIRTRKLRR